MSPMALFRLASFALTLNVTGAGAASVTFCSNFADSSGVAGGQIHSLCGASPNDTWSSSTFGSFTGTARGSADSTLGPYHLFDAVNLLNYAGGSYDGIFAGATIMTFSDSIRVTGATGTGVLEFDVNLSGSLTHTGNFIDAEWCTVLSVGPMNNGPCNTIFKNPIKLVSQPFLLDGNFHPLQLLIGAVAYADDRRAVGFTYSGEVIADLEHTATLQSVILMIPDGQSTTGVVLDSEGGLQYPLTVESVPEPSPTVLLVSGSALLAYLKCRSGAQFLRRKRGQTGT